MALGRINRVSTGIPGLDKLIEGGFPEGSAVFVSGAPGTGKTILAMHFIAEGLRRNESCSYICIDQSPTDIQKQGAQISVDLQGTNWISSQEVRYGMGKKPENIEEKVDLILEITKRQTPKRIVLDSISALQIEDGIKARLLARRLIEGLKRTGATVLITGEALNSEYSDDTTPFLVDVVIILKATEIGTQTTRNLIIRKARFSEVTGGAHELRFTKRGIEVL